jgi:F-type H+-transporting ATPase subunit alpha
MNYTYQLGIVNQGPRIALRGKVSDTLITGMRIVDSLLPIGRGQRQLIVGDRFTGKTSIFISILLTNHRNNYLNSIDGFGCKRLFGFYVSISQNLSKLFLVVSLLSSINDLSFLFIATHSSSNSLLSLYLPSLSVSFCESISIKGFDLILCFDNLSLHAKNARQINLILGQIPSRNCYSSDIFNLHSALLERSFASNLSFSSSITILPVIETVSEDISEYISTNVISITDGQIYLANELFMRGQRPAIDSGLSVSRIGSSAQCQLMKLLSIGIKNDLTNLRQSLINFQSSNSFDAMLGNLFSIELIFYQDALFISSLEESLLSLLLIRLDILGK